VGEREGKTVGEREGKRWGRERLREGKRVRDIGMGEREGKRVQCGGGGKEGRGKEGEREREQAIRGARAFLAEAAGPTRLHSAGCALLTGPLEFPLLLPRGSKRSHARLARGRRTRVAGEWICRPEQVYHGGLRCEKFAHSRCENSLT
jgi:hypothetical protein